MILVVLKGLLENNFYLKDLLKNSASWGIPYNSAEFKSAYLQPGLTTFPERCGVRFPCRTAQHHAMLQLTVQLSHWIQSVICPDSPRVFQDTNICH